MRQKLCLMMLLIFCVFSFLPASEVKNEDKPLKGTWDFKPVKVWIAANAGDEPLASPSQLQVSDDGTLYFHEFKKDKSYIFDSNGKLKKIFGVKGEGPGEVKRHLSLLLAGDMVAAGDIDRIHFFTKEGKYVKSIKNDIFSRPAHFFLNDHEFIYAPVSVVNLPGKKGKIALLNLETQKEKVLKEFTVFKGGVSQGMAAFVVGITPQMIIGNGGDKIYCGINNSYKIDAIDLDGKQLNSFSLERGTKKISKKEKIDHFVKNAPGIPMEQLEILAKSLPEELAYFYKIDVINGLVYVYLGGFHSPSNQKIDIFSPDGKYIYRADIGFGKDTKIKATQLLMKKNHVYVVLENAKGEMSIGKYKVTLPTE
jgi:hypothetical protein